MVMTDCMIDCETTGTNPAYNGIMQIAAVQFNYDTGEIGPVFNRCLAMAPNRFWSDSTRTWWGKQRKDIFNSIIDRMEDPGTVMRDFVSYASTDVPSGGLRFWAKPTIFDYTFVESYCEQFGLPMPFSYRTTRDLNTFMAAMAGGVNHQDMEHIEPPTNAHDALADCVFQLKLLFAAKDRNFGIQDAIYEEIN